jgi:hypothetical protein
VNISTSAEKSKCPKYDNVDLPQKIHEIKISPGSMGIDIVMTNLWDFPKDESIQLKGLDIILCCLDDDENDNIKSSMLFMNERFASILIQALGLNEFEVRWRAHTVLMMLSSSHGMCKHIESQGGCERIINILKESSQEDPILQLALWSLSNLCRVGKFLYFNSLFLPHK